MTAAIGLAIIIALMACLAVGLALAYANEKVTVGRLDAALGRATAGLLTERAAHADTRARLEKLIAVKDEAIASLEKDVDACSDPDVVRDRLRRLLSGDTQAPAPTEAGGVRPPSGAGVGGGEGGVRRGPGQ